MSDPGTAKTRAHAHAFTERRRAGGGKALVLAPKSILQSAWGNDIDKFLPAVCPDFGREDRGESEENYGSTATSDFACLQALSRRIHFGKFVAESKFRSDPEKYTRMIRASDREGIAASITNSAVEQTILERLRLKGLTYGTDPGAPGGTEGPVKINVDALVSMYKDFVIPLTKEVEVEYLMQRLEDPSA